MENISPELEQQNKEALLKMSTGGGRGFNYYPRINNLRSLIPTTLQQIEEFKMTDIVLLNNVVNYLVDLDQGYVFSRLSCPNLYQDVTDLPWTNLRKFICTTLLSHKLNTDDRNELAAYKDLFIVMWDRRDDNKLNIFSKVIRYFKYGTTDMQQIVSSKVPAEKIPELVCKLISKHF